MKLVNPSFSFFATTSRHLLTKRTSLNHFVSSSVLKMSSNDGAIEAERAKAGFYFVEEENPGVKIQMELNGILHKEESLYQSIQVIDTYWGRTLVTDGKTQSAQHDEFIYHETLVHAPLLKSGMLHANGEMPSTVFIGGGGELATAREVLRHSSVKRVVMVDLDEAVINVCKKFLPEWGGEAVATDPRLELIVGDAYSYLMNTDETFDVIVMDISDPIEAGPGIMLYTQEFYQHAKTRLNMPHGVFVTQSGTADILKPPGVSPDKPDPTCFGPILNTLASVFDCAVPYATYIPSYGGDWGFVMAFQANQSNDEEAIQETCMPPSGLVDKLLSQDITGGADALRHYDGTCHLRLFSLPKATRSALAKDDRIMTKDNPIFMF